MDLCDEIRIARQKAFFTQESLARELNVAVSTVNRWESGKSKPSISALKSLKVFCLTHEVPFDEIEKAWLNTNLINKECEE